MQTQETDTEKILAGFRESLNGIRSRSGVQFAPGSVNCYTADACHFIAYLARQGISLEKCTSADFIDFLKGRNYAGKTSQRTMSAVLGRRGLFAFLNYSMGMAFPFTRADLPSEMRGPAVPVMPTQIISEELYKQLITRTTELYGGAYSASRGMLTAILAMRTGAKPGELISADSGLLAIEQSPLNARFIIHPKHFKMEEVQFVPTDYEAPILVNYPSLLSQFKAEKGTSEERALIVNSIGKRLNNTRSLRRNLELYCKEFDISPSISLRDLRRTYLANQAQAA